LQRHFAGNYLSDRQAGPSTLQRREREKENYQRDSGIDKAAANHRSLKKEIYKLKKEKNKRMWHEQASGLGNLIWEISGEGIFL